MSFSRTKISFKTRNSALMRKLNLKVKRLHVLKKSFKSNLTK